MSEAVFSLLIMLYSHNSFVYFSVYSVVYFLTYVKPRIYSKIQHFL